MKIPNRNLIPQADLLLVASLAVAVTMLAPATYAWQEPVPAFEVATIKPSDPKNTRPPTLRFVSGRFEVSGMTLKDLIAMAYAKTLDKDRQVLGGPVWTRFQKYDVVATEDETVLAKLNTLPAQERGERSRAMIQELLSERFKLSIHREMTDFNTYTLLLTKGGPKMKRGVLDPKLPANIPQERINRMAPGFLEGHNATADLLAKVLSSLPEMSGRMVIDKTGLNGRYDFTVKWAPDSIVAADSSRPESQEALPQLFTALQEQLGLRLVSAKSSLEVIVVDSAMPPSEN